MAISFTQALIKAKCGELSWLCCVGSADKLIEARNVLEGMTDADILSLYKLICACDAPGTGGPVGPGGGDNQARNCVESVVLWACQPETLSRIAALKSLLLLAAGAPITMPDTLKNALVLLSATLDKLQTFCQTRPTDAVALPVVRALCHVLTVFESATSGVPEGIRPIVQYFLSSLFASGAGVLTLAALKGCCSNQTISATPLPTVTPGGVYV